MGTWDDLEERLVISTQDGVVKKPKPEDLDRFEAESGFRLPDTYRDFALTFGPGEFGSGGWKFATPGFPRDDHHDLANVGRRWRNTRLVRIDDSDLSRQFGVDAARARKLVPFCDQRNAGDAFAWDPSDVTDAGRHECGIYLITGDHRNVPMPKVASTFREFVLEYALGGGFERHLYQAGAGAIGEWQKPGPISFAQSSISEGDG